MRFLAIVLLAFATLLANEANAQQKEIKIGFIYDLTGPFAGGGSEPAQIGTKAAIDYFNEKGGVAGYKINAIFVDAQSKVDVAINEMTRLLDQEKVDLVMGVYSSAQCVPMVQQIDQRKKFLWINVCIATAVFKDKKLSYVFRPQAHSDQFGAWSCDYINHYAQSKFGIAPKSMKVAIIHEDGPYGVGVAAGNEAQCKKHGMNIVLKEGYSATAPDLSSLVTKLKRARPDVLLHTGYNPDITLFLRQSKEQGFKVKAMIGHGAGHSQIDKLRQTFGEDVNYFHSIDPAAAQLLEPKTLKAGIPELIKEMVKRYEAVKGPAELPPHTSMGFNNTWIFRHPGGRHAAGLRGEVLSAGTPARRPERARFSGGHAIRERPRAHRLAARDPDHGSGAAFPQGPRVRALTCSRSRSSPRRSTALPP
jgi:branched-chain amino acid transport system substrate-binding protein